MADPNDEVKKMLADFVCVRIIQGNGMDLRMFQFDYDMSFSIHFMNAGRTVYGRYGSRNGNEEEADKLMTIEGLNHTMQKVLKYHRLGPNARGIYASKQPKPIKGPRQAEKLPGLGKFDHDLRSGEKMAASCLHCHQIRSARRRDFRENGGLFSLKELSPYPLPAVIGIEIDPKTASTISKIEEGSAATKAGLKIGDEIWRIRNDRVIYSLADIQWALHHLHPGAQKLNLKVLRGEQRLDFEVPLEKDWRKKSEIAWRVSTWDLARMGFGGMRLRKVEEAERERLGIAEGKMALTAWQVGQYGEHAIAKRAGLKIGDVVVGFANLDSDLSEDNLLRTVLGRWKRGESVEIEFLREGQEKTATLKLQ